jgi:hypothetical protein
VPSTDALGDRVADEVVVEHFAELIVARRRGRQQHVQVDVKAHALRPVLLAMVDADAHGDLVAAKKDATAARHERVEQGCVHRRP